MSLCHVFHGCVCHHIHSQKEQCSPESFLHSVERAYLKFSKYVHGRRANEQRKRRKNSISGIIILNTSIKNWKQYLLGPVMCERIIRRANHYFRVIGWHIVHCRTRIFNTTIDP